MKKRRRKLPDWEDNPFITISVLLENKKIAVATIVSAIEQNGIYTWDSYGRFGLASGLDKDRVLHLLAKYYEWQETPIQELSLDESQSPIERWGSCSDNAYGHFGWAAEVLPDFDAIRRKQEALDAEEIKTATLSTQTNSSGNFDQDLQKQQRAIFRSMKDLTADEVSITFIGDESESGIEANNLLEISVRGKTKRVALASLDLIDRHRNRLNSQCAVLLGMVQKKKLPSTDSNKKKISRLREMFHLHLGVIDDPFASYRKGVGWVPRFQIFDKRGVADKRAREKAERKSISYNDQIKYSGDEFGDTSQIQQSYGDRKDIADEWLKNSDPREKG